MPDLSIERARWCGSNEYWQTTVAGSHGEEYSVVWEGHEYTCTCPAFKFRKGKECKHIKQASEHHCRYGWEAAAGSPIEMGKRCPKCGEETRVMSYAV